MRAACRDVDGLVLVLLKPPGLYCLWLHRHGPHMGGPDHDAVVKDGIKNLQGGPRGKQAVMVTQGRSMKAVA
jgi:hypothetical protein